MCSCDNCLLCNDSASVTERLFHEVCVDSSGQAPVSLVFPKAFPHPLSCPLDKLHVSLWFGQLTHSEALR